MWICCPQFWATCVMAWKNAQTTQWIDTVTSLLWIMCDLINIIMIAWSVVNSSSGNAIYRWLKFVLALAFYLPQNDSYVHCFVLCMWLAVGEKHLISISDNVRKSQNVSVFNYSQRFRTKTIENTFEMNRIKIIWLSIFALLLFFWRILWLFVMWVKRLHFIESVE